MIDCRDAANKTFLDIGNGSGLFSLAARRLGFKVFSFDFDKKSVGCVKSLKEKYFPQDENWQITEGSVLDKDFLTGLGEFDVVYSWGVLHHTGEMWAALENVIGCVKKNGELFIAIYNDEGTQSKIWFEIKKFYNRNFLSRLITKLIFIPFFICVFLFIDLLKFQNPLKRYREYKKRRGMSMMTDWIDWIGGYPFEVASTEQIFNFYRDRGFILSRLKSTNRSGCNEFVLKKI